MPEQPNILFIVLDTLRRDRLTSYGHTQDTSPYFDAFAQDATRFERAVAPAQWTIPAHGSMFTGFYPSTHQLTQAYESLSDSYPTLAEKLQIAGYQTTAFCNNPLLGVLDNGLQRGFDTFYNYAGAAPNRPVDTTRGPLRRALHTRFRQFARRMTNQFSRSDRLFRWALNPLLVPLWTRAVNFKGNTALSVDDALAYWRAHDHTKQPLFMFVNLMGAHLPYRPPQDYLRHVAPDIANDKHAYKFMAQFNADSRAWLSPSDEPLADWQQRALDGFYDAEIAHQDVQLGRLLNGLQASGALDNTLVVITADHGEGHGDHNFIGHGFVVYQELVHVPLLIRHPDRYPAGHTVGRNVSTRRLFHTILEAAGVTTVDHSLSLHHALNGEPDSETLAFAEAFPPDNLLNVLQNSKPELVQERHLRQVRRGVYAGDHKLALVGDVTQQLFNVANDPTEVRDVATQHPDIVQHLGQAIDAFIADAQAQRRGPNGKLAMSEQMAEQMRALGYLE